MTPVVTRSGPQNTAAAGEAVLELTDVTVSYGPVEAVGQVSFRVMPGTVVALVGPNGAGKTTLLETIQGYLIPDAGRVRVFGLDPAVDTSRLAHRWGVMPQQGGLPMGLTVGEAVRLFRDLHGSTAQVDNLLATVGLSSLANRKWRRTSGGEQQRLSLAIALCGGSDLLLLDEPTAAVDAAGREQVLELIATRAASGSAVLLTTHRFDDVERVADRVVMIANGHVVADSELDALTADRHHIRFTARPGIPTDSLSQRLGPVQETAPGRYEVQTAPDPASVTTLVSWLADQGIAPESVEAGRTSLEARFLELTRTTPARTASPTRGSE